MSAENVEVVRTAWEAFTRHDNAAIFPLYDPDIEIIPEFPDRVTEVWTESESSSATG